MMSALPPKADIGGWSTDVRFVPMADMHRFIRSLRWRLQAAPAGRFRPSAENRIRVHVRFSRQATEMLRGSKMTRCINCALHATWGLV